MTYWYIKIKIKVLIYLLVCQNQINNFEQVIYLYFKIKLIIFFENTIIKLKLNFWKIIFIMFLLKNCVNYDFITKLF